jgi:hypothetical protein
MKGQAIGRLFGILSLGSARESPVGLLFIYFLRYLVAWLLFFILKNKYIYTRVVSIRRDPIRSRFRGATFEFVLKKIFKNLFHLTQVTGV